MFVDAHRLAMGFKNFASTEKEFIAMQQQKAADRVLSDAGSHSLSAQTPLFPMALLNLPWIHVLKQLSPISASSDDDDENSPKHENVLQVSQTLIQSTHLSPATKRKQPSDQTKIDLY